MKKLFFILSIVLLPLLSNAQELNARCSIIVYEKNNNLPLNEVEVYLRETVLISSNEGIVKIDCGYLDTIVVKKIGYETQVLKYSKSLDTIFLELNSLEFEPVFVIANNQKIKSYKIGKKNNQVDFGAGMKGGDGVKVYSPILNNTGHRLKLKEAYIFIFDRGSSDNNIVIDIYKNDNGRLGRPILTGIGIIEKKKNKGWFKLSLSENLVIPKDGFIILVKVTGTGADHTIVGMIECQEKQQVDSFWLQPSGNINRLPNNYSEKHFGLKFYAKSI